MDTKFTVIAKLENLERRSVLYPQSKVRLLLLSLQRDLEKKAMLFLFF